MEVPEFFKKAIDEIGGKNLYGQSRYRVVWSKDQRWEAGLLKGCPKYLWPDGRLMECFILEVWYPPQYFGDPKEWNDAICGPFPHQGFYGIKSPLIIWDGDEAVMMPLDSGALDAIRQKHLHDLEWQGMNGADRMRAIIEQQTVWERNRQHRADKQADELFDHYNAHKHELDQADERVFSFPKHLDVLGKGNKMPVNN
jgi:hypothetical protein